MHSSEAMANKERVQKSKKMGPKTDEVQPAWHRAARVEGDQGLPDDSFTLEDEDTASSCQQLLSGCWWVCAVPNGSEPVVWTVSEGFTKATGYSVEEAAGKPCSLFMGPKTATGVAASVTAALGWEGAGLLPIRLLKKDGKQLKLMVCTVALPDSGIYPLVLLLAKDPGEPTDESSMQKWTDQVKKWVCGSCTTQLTADDIKIMSCSSTLGTMTGYSTEQLHGASLLRFAGNATSSSSMQHIFSGHLGGTQTMVKVLLYRHDGSTFWAVLVSCPWLHPVPGHRVQQEQQQQPWQLLQQQQQQQQQRDQAPCQPHEHGLQQSSKQQQIQQEQPPRCGFLLACDVTLSQPLRLGKYILGKVLGQGASGTVRLARNTSTDEIVAVKVVDARRFHSITEIEQVQEEIACLAQLRHPNIIRLLEVMFVGGCFHFVMEYASGGSMVRYIYGRNNRQLTEETTQQLFGQILSALEYCHKRRVIHRDLKPENILMEGETAKIADFGLAGIMTPFSNGSFTLQCGTPEFSAPEVVSGKEYEGSAIDLWSVGVMLYEALSGQLPFRGSSQSTLFQAIQQGVYEPLPQHVSSAARNLVKRLLTVDPAARVGWAELSSHPWLLGTSLNGSSSGLQRSSEAGSQIPQDKDSIQDVAAVDGALETGTTAAAAAAACAGSIAAPVFDWTLPSASSTGDGQHQPQAGGQDLLDQHIMRGYLGGAAGPGPGSTYAHDQPWDGVSGSADLLQPSRSAVSFTSKSCHESVRVIITDSNKDDPITAAIQRSAEGTALQQCRLGDDSPSSSKTCCRSPGVRLQHGSSPLQATPQNSPAGRLSHAVKHPAPGGLLCTSSDGAGRAAVVSHGVAAKLSLSSSGSNMSSPTGSKQAKDATESTTMQQRIKFSSPKPKRVI